MTVEAHVEGKVFKINQRQAGTHTVTEIVVNATPRKKNRKSGEWQDLGDFFTVILPFWDEDGDQIVKVVGEGDKITACGSMSVRVYSRNDGTPGATHELRQPRVLSVKRDDPQEGGQEARSGANTTQGWGSVGNGYSGPQNATQGSFDDTPPF